MLQLNHLTSYVVVLAALEACAQDNRPIDFNAHSAAGKGAGAEPGTGAAGTGTRTANNGGNEPSLGGQPPGTGSVVPTVGGSSNPTNTASSAMGGTNTPSATTSSTIGGFVSSLAGAAGSSAKSPACQLPVDIGTCPGSSTYDWHYAFNSLTQRCERFRYSGCGGNANRFEKLEDCIAACDPGGFDVCGTSDDCALVQLGCCGTCEPHIKSDFAAVNVRYATVNSCNMDVQCGPCPTYTGAPTAQNFGAHCVESRCQVYEAREEPVSGCDPDAYSAGSTHALEVARAARPDTPIPIIILLNDPGSIAGMTVEQRQAQLAPYQDPIEVLLAQRGAIRIERFWLINAISSELPAQYVPEILCWPAVTSLTTDLSYWEVVDRPWDLASVGSAECPRTDSGCPDHCMLMLAEPYDPTLGCMREREPIACTVDDQGRGVGGICGANSITGRVYCDIANFIPRDPAFLGWRDCTAEEEQQCAPAVGKRCP